VNPLAQLLITGDVQFVRWSEVVGENKPLITTDASTPGDGGAGLLQTGASAFNMNWSDQWVFKVGTQYEATPWLTLRAGYNYGKSPLDPTRGLENITFPAIAEHHYTAGASVQWDQTTINVGGYYSPAPTLRGSAPDRGIDSYETSVAQLAVNTGVSYRF
jgi:long-chain fatty acid transport protein